MSLEEVKNVEEARNLEELKGKRLRWVEANRENGFEKGIERLLTDLYPDNAHFIYELLQNAEDAKATEVRFILKKDGVEFEHNGKPFTFEDVESITSIGVSTKKDDPTNIGKFGVGFKAVFAYTNKPEIKSVEYHFRICDLVVPDTEGLSSCVLGENETRFSFPFDNPKKSPENARIEIERNLRQLDESVLLFLSNIRRIEYLLPDSSLGFLERRQLDENRIEILVQRREYSEPVPVLFLRFQKTVGVNDEEGNPKDCRIAVAFGLEQTEDNAKKSDKRREQPSTIQWKIKPLEPGQVSIYFPAEKETSNLKFHLHAPFASTVARDSVRDCEANDELRDHLAGLIAESMTAIRDRGLLTVEFLATLPNERDSLSPFYEPIRDKLVQAFKNKDLTPMKKGGYATAEGIFRGQRKLSDLIVDADLATLLGKELSLPLWVANPRQRNQREENFLSMLNIPEWTTKDLVSQWYELDEDGRTEQIIEWLSEKSETWHGELYSLLGEELLDDDGNFKKYNYEINYEMLFQCLPIVRISDGTYHKGKDCFFPDEYVKHDPDFPRVAKEVCSHKKMGAFLKSIGVRELGEAERVEAILKQRYSEESIKPDKPDKQDLERFIAFVEKEPDQVDLFKDYYIFQLENEKWGKPGRIYLDSPYIDTGLSIYYDELNDHKSYDELNDHESSDERYDERYSRRVLGEIYDNYRKPKKALSSKEALSSKYKESDIQPEKLVEFAKKVGVQTELKPEKQGIPWDHPEKLKHRVHGNQTKYGTNKDYDIHEFKVLLDNPDVEKSKLIWGTMKELPENFLQASYRPNRSTSIVTGYSTLVWKLRKHGWVPQKQDAEEKLRFVKPTDASVERLPNGFPFDNGAKWLEAIEFGIAEQDRKEEERQREEQNTQGYRQKSEVAKELGFSSVEEAEDLARMSKENPEFISKWKAERQKPVFPEKVSPDPGRRTQRVSEEYSDSPEKKYTKQERSVRTSRGAIEPHTWLKENYTNESEQMVCQICEEEMPFKKRNGEYYFEAVEALSQEHFNKEHKAQFLALCPLCAAKYKEFVKRDENVMQEVKNNITESDSPYITLRLGEDDTSIRETSIRFVETHWQGLKTIL